MTPKLVHCPHCKLHNGVSMTLGSITTDGNFIIRKQYGKEVMIASSSYTIVCDCGFLIRIDDGRISERAASYYEESFTHG